MSLLAAGIGAATSVFGSLFGSRGAKKRAKAERQAAELAIKREQDLHSRWSTNLEDLISQKEDKLFDLGGIFDRFQSTGAFGRTNTEQNLRRAQEDFALLAAGDFTAFEQQLRKTMSDALVTTVGTGSPIGAFAQFGADAQMGMRLQGMQSATGLSDFFASQAQNLLGLEFGLMDQSFEVGYNLDRNQISAINQQGQLAAQQAGASQMAMGSFLNNTGQALMGFAGYVQQSQELQRQHDARMAQIGGMQRQQPQQQLPVQMNPISMGGYELPGYDFDYPDGIPLGPGVLPSIDGPLPHDPARGRNWMPTVNPLTWERPPRRSVMREDQSAFRALTDVGADIASR
jgi:hypothetical protein